MKSLVVPINFTNNAANAARYAADLALSIDADIHLLHVMDPSYAYEETEEKGRSLVKRLQKVVADRTHGQVNCSFSLQLGGVESGIEECCDRIRPFLVVMGAEDEKYHGGFSHGHVDNAINHLSFPLLIIPAGATFHVVRQVALACEAEDILSGIPVSLELLVELKKCFGCTFDILNVTGNKNRGNAESFFEQYKWKESMGDLYPELHFVKSEQVAEGVQKYLLSHGADWLLIFPRRHRLLEWRIARYPC